MKKANKTRNGKQKDEMRPEYDFIGGERGKYYQAMQAGYTVTIHKADGTTEVREVRPNRGVVVLEPDVQAYFPDSNAVNRALRGLIELMPKKAKTRHRP